MKLCVRDAAALMAPRAFCVKALAAHTPSRRTRPRGADALAAHTPQQRSGPLDSSDSTGGGSGEGSDDGSNSGSRSSSIVALEFMRLPASN